MPVQQTREPQINKLIEDKKNAKESIQKAEADIRTTTLSCEVYYRYFNNGVSDAESNKFLELVNIRKIRGSGDPGYIKSKGQTKNDNLKDRYVEVFSTAKCSPFMNSPPTGTIMVVGAKSEDIIICDENTYQSNLFSDTSSAPDELYMEQIISQIDQENFKEFLKNEENNKKKIPDCAQEFLILTDFSSEEFRQRYNEINKALEDNYHKLNKNFNATSTSDYNCLKKEFDDRKQSIETIYRQYEKKIDELDHDKDNDNVMDKKGINRLHFINKDNYNLVFQNLLKFFLQPVEDVRKKQYRMGCKLLEEKSYNANNDSSFKNLYNFSGLFTICNLPKSPPKALLISVEKLVKTNGAKIPESQYISFFVQNDNILTKFKSSRIYSNNYFYVLGHGSPFGLQMNSTSEVFSVDESNIDNNAKYIKKHLDEIPKKNGNSIFSANAWCKKDLKAVETLITAKNTSVKPIVFLSCSLGAGINSFAECFSKNLTKLLTVYAANTSIWSDINELIIAGTLQYSLDSESTKKEVTIKKLESTQRKEKENYELVDKIAKAGIGHFRMFNYAQRVQVTNSGSGTAPEQATGGANHP